jgi:hypothetical protein
MTYRYANIGKYNSAINVLLTELNLGVEEPVFNMKTAELRLRNLEKLKAERGIKPAAQPLALAPKPSTIPAPAPSAPGRPSRSQCVAILKAVSPTVRVPDEWSDNEVFLETERAAYQSHLRLPGMRTDAELANEYWRQDASKITGSARYLRGQAKDKIASILKGK